MDAPTEKGESEIMDPMLEQILHQWHKDVIEEFDAQVLALSLQTYTPWTNILINESDLMKMNSKYSIFWLGPSETFS